MKPEPFTMMNCLVLLLVLAETVRGRYNALTFADKMEGNFMFHPDMGPVERTITVCSWVKKLREAGTPTWFSYATPQHSDEIAISDDGHYNQLFDVWFSLADKVDYHKTMGTWTHFCFSWSSSSRTQRVYYNGSLIGSRETPSGNDQLGKDGILMLGNDQDTYGKGVSVSNIFGGMLYKLNIFRKELLAGDILDMYKAGLCSNIEETKFDFARHIRWEDILLEPRNEFVTEVGTGCKDEEPASRWDVLYEKQFYNKVLTKDLLEQLKPRWNMLENFLGSKITNEFIDHFKSYHEDTTSSGNSNWDVLHEGRFLDKVLTKELLEELTKTRSRWALLENFLGATVTDGFIEHFKSYHE